MSMPASTDETNLDIQIDRRSTNCSQVPALLMNLLRSDRPSKRAGSDVGFVSQRVQIVGSRWFLRSQ